MDTMVYNNLISSFEPKYLTNNAHKSSELRSVVKKIRKQAQSSPVYLLNFTNKKQSHVLSIKEASMKLLESMDILADDSNDALFSKKKAYSSDTEQIGAELIDAEQTNLPGEFTLRVKQLANSQVNMGKDFYETGKGLPAGSYKFRVTVDDIGYDFQYNVRKDANHLEVISGLSSFITKAKIGLVAEPYYPENDRLCMRIESVQLGTSNGYDSFSFEDKSTDSGGRGIVSYYGLNRMRVAPQNAEFLLNGVEKSSLNNELTLGRLIKVDLRKPSDTDATIGYCPDSELILEGISDFVSHYNELIGHDIEYSKDAGIPSKLQREMNALHAPFKNVLEANGISFDDDGFMVLNSSLAEEAINSGELQKLFQADSPLALRLSGKGESVKINPMEYVDKRVVSYPNFEKPPRGYSYINSLYSGLLFNYYC